MLTEEDKVNSRCHHQSKGALESTVVLKIQRGVIVAFLKYVSLYLTDYLV